MLVYLSRAPIWKKDRKHLCSCSTCSTTYDEGIDITIKSSKGFGRQFAPTWEMVMGHKRGEITNDEYAQMYINILNNVQEEVYDRLYEYGVDHDFNITFLCYCPDNQFCHTHLVINYLCSKYPDKFGTLLGRVF